MFCMSPVIIMLIKLQLLAVMIFLCVYLIYLRCLNQHTGLIKSDKIHILSHNYQFKKLVLGFGMYSVTGTLKLLHF